MGTTSGGEVTKAFFQSCDTGYTFTVQYNPTNFKFDKPVSWKEHDDQGQEGSLEFQKATPATMSCELIFDTTADGSDVRTTWVNSLLRFTNPEVKPSQGEAAELGKQRPHKVYFYWGDFQLLGVIESISVTYLMFASDGRPLRAKVTVKMKEWKASEYKGSGTGTYYGSAPVKLVTIGAGQTITAVSSNWRQVAEANNIDDPLNGLQAGDQIVVPSQNGSK